MGARKQLRLALEAAVPGTRVVSDWQHYTPDPADRALLQLLRTSIRHEGTQGRYKSEFELGVIAPAKSIEPDKEDELDDLLDEVIQALDEFTWLSWESAERGTAPNDHPAYRINLTVSTKGV